MDIITFLVIIMVIILIVNINTLREQAISRGRYLGGRSRKKQAWPSDQHMPKRIVIVIIITKTAVIIMIVKMMWEVTVPHFQVMSKNMKFNNND